MADMLAGISRKPNEPTKAHGGSKADSGAERGVPDAGNRLALQGLSVAQPLRSPVQANGTSYTYTPYSLAASIMARRLSGDAFCTDAPADNM